MTIKEFIKKNRRYFAQKTEGFTDIIFSRKFNLIIYTTILALAFVIYSFTYNYVNDQKNKNEKNLENFFKSEEFSEVKNSIFENLKSPYIEFTYKIENNDSIGKILKKFKVSDSEKQKIIKGLKKKNLTSLYAGRELNIVLKKLSSGKNEIISVLYPINNTLSVEIRKKKDLFEIKENILKLTKKEVVIKNTISNNLYSAAIEADIEPNIIIEFARIYGFEIDFQRDIRKGDTFEIYYEKFLDDNNIVRDTGKIIYAHMNVNNREINLYNFKDKKEKADSDYWVEC